MLRLEILYWTYYQSISKGPITCCIMIEGEILALQPAGNDLGHPWIVCAFQSLPFDMLISIYLSTLFEPKFHFYHQKNLNHSLKSELTTKNPEFAQKMQISATKIKQKDKYGGVQY